MRKRLAPIHPGEILLNEFLQPMAISQYRLAKDVNVPARRINEIVHGKRSMTADTALRLSRYFGMTEQFWMNLQSRAYACSVGEAHGTSVRRPAGTDGRITASSRG